MRASVIIRSKDEADRLRLTLGSLAVQTEVAEVVVVNDGSSDHTEEVIAAAAKTALVRSVRHKAAKGRSAAANAGAAKARGEILIFLDGDTLAGPDLVERHIEVHRRTRGSIARGETFHLRCTRFFQDPESGSPMAGQEARVERMSPAERSRMQVTLREVMENFAAVEARAQPGVYPGAGPRQLYELEMNALREERECKVLWAAAAGSNQSVPASAFNAVGGFDPSLTINEHRELALRLCQKGLRMAPANGARSYHMTHRSGWRDPLVDSTWEEQFYSAHPIAAVPLLSVLWASLAEPSPIPKLAQILSLSDLERAAARCGPAHGAEGVRKAHLQMAAGLVAS